jgi:RNA polymerase sigma-70 factor (ECF subfamily)
MDPSSVFSISSHSSEENREVLAPLLAKAKRGEQEAFGEIYNLYFKKIYQFIFYRVSAKEIAEDLTEDVFLKAFTKIASLKEDVTFAGWLYQIARNKVIDHYREKKIVVALDEVENTLEYESNIIDVVNLEHQQKVLLKFMKELTSEQQVVLKLKFFEDLDNAEIADAIGKNEGAVRVIQHRAITKLQELISQSGVNNG